MGILHSTTRFLTSTQKDDDEEEEEYKRLSYPVLQNRDTYCGESSPNKLFSIYKSLKCWVRKVGSIFCLAKAAEPHPPPLLPVQNPAILTTEPLLLQRPTTAIFYDDDDDDEEESEDDVVDRDSWSEDEIYPAGSETSTDDHIHGVVISIDTTTVVGKEERWIKHYSSRHKILLVGEGDFSFSACLAVAFGSSATNIIATSLNCQAFLKKNYGSAMSNIAELRSRGAKVMHEIDATQIATHELLRQIKFDRIIFNFPFAGFFPNLPPEFQLCCHRNLIFLFLENAKQMICSSGEIHISHKTNGHYHREFMLENIATSQKLRLISAVKFERGDYPGYNTKYGFGGDNNFNCHPSKTFKFGL